MEKEKSVLYLSVNDSPVEYKGKMVYAVEGDGCLGCLFLQLEKGNCCEVGSRRCNASTSKDGKSLWYKEHAKAVSHKDVEVENPKSALDVQVGGDHYKKLKIQPIEYTLANNLGFCEGNIVKYITRYKDKNGIEDLKKIKHYADLLIEQMEKEGKENA